MCGMLRLLCRRAIVALLLKTRGMNSQFLSSAKDCSEGHLLWLVSMLKDVIQPDQAYVVPWQSIFDNTYLVQNILHLLCLPPVPQQGENIWCGVSELSYRHPYTLTGISPCFVGVPWCTLNCCRRLGKILQDLEQDCWLSSGRVSRLPLDLQSLSSLGGEGWCLQSWIKPQMTWWMWKLVKSPTWWFPSLGKWVKRSGLVAGDKWAPSPMLNIYQGTDTLLYLGIYSFATNPSPAPKRDKMEARVSEQVWRWADLLWVLAFREDEVIVILPVLPIFWYCFNSLCLFPRTWTWIFFRSGQHRLPFWQLYLCTMYPEQVSKSGFPFSEAMLILSLQVVFIHVLSNLSL